MNGKLRPQPNDPDWKRLLEAEQRLEAEIVAAEAEARERVAQAREAALAAVPDPQAMAALAAAQEQADSDRHRAEIARIDAQAETTVRALTDAPDALIDALAQLALGAALTDQPLAENR